MKAKFGAIVVDGSGKINGFVASKNKSGNYFRTKVSPSQPRTEAQLAVRSLLSSLSQSWRDLTEDQRSAWNSATSLYKSSNVFGDMKTMSGFNLYQRINNNLTQIGLTTVDTPTLPTGNDSFESLVLTYTSGTPSLSLAFTRNGSNASYAKLMATAPLSAGKSYVESDFRIIDILDDTQTSPANILAAYTAKFGSVGEVGQKIFIKIIPVNASGQDGTASTTSAISAS